MKRRAFCLGAGAWGALALAGCGERAETPRVTSDVLFSQSLPDLHGTVREVAQWRGRPMLVNFWATWCAPCVREMPDLDQLRAEFPGVAFVGIGIDSTPNMLAFIEKVPVAYPLLEARSSGLDLMRELGNKSGGLPFTVILAEDGRIVRAIAGQVVPDDIRATLQPLV